MTAAIASGDSEAFARFYREWFDRAFHFAQKATGRDEAFCLDVVQDSMMRVIRSMPPMQTEGEIAGWLRAVTISCAYDRLRKEQRMRRRELAATESSKPRDDDNEDRLRWMEDELLQLDAAVHPLMVLRYRLGWTLDRIGKLLGLQPGAVDGRIRRATSELRKKAEAEHETHG